MLCRPVLWGPLGQPAGARGPGGRPHGVAGSAVTAGTSVVSRCPQQSWPLGAAFCAAHGREGAWRPPVPTHVRGRRRGRRPRPPSPSPANTRLSGHSGSVVSRFRAPLYGHPVTRKAQFYHRAEFARGVPGPDGGFLRSPPVETSQRLDSRWPGPCAAAGRNPKPGPSPAPAHLPTVPARNRPEGGFLLFHLLYVYDAFPSANGLSRRALWKGTGPSFAVPSEPGHPPSPHCTRARASLRPALRAGGCVGPSPGPARPAAPSPGPGKRWPCLWEDGTGRASPAATASARPSVHSHPEPRA